MEDPENKHKKQDQSPEPVDSFDDFDDGFDADLTDFDTEFDDFDVDLEEDDLTDFDAEFDLPEDMSKDVVDHNAADDLGDKSLKESAVSDFDAPIEDDFALDDTLDDGFEPLDKAEQTDMAAPEEMNESQKKQPGAKKSKLFNIVVFAVFGIIGALIVYFQFLSGGDTSQTQVAQVRPLPATPEAPSPQQENAGGQTNAGPANLSQAQNNGEDLDALLGLTDTPQEETSIGVTGEPASLDESINPEDPFAVFDTDLPSPQAVTGEIDVPEDTLGLEQEPVFDAAPQPMERAPQIDNGAFVELPSERAQATETPVIQEPAPRLQETPTPQQDAQASLQSQEVLEEIKAELATLSNRMQGLEVKVGQNTRKIDSDTVDEGILSAIRSLEQKVDNIANGRSTTATPNVQPVQEVINIRQPRAVPPSQNDTIVVRPIPSSVLPQPKPRQAGAQSSGSVSQAPAQKVWILRAAQPGKAWLSQPGSQEIRAVSVGEVFEPYGKIMFIGRGQKGWVVQGAKATLGQ